MTAYKLSVKLDNDDRVSMSDVPFDDDGKILSISSMYLSGTIETFEKIFNVIDEELHEETYKRLEQQVAFLKFENDNLRSQLERYKFYKGEINWLEGSDWWHEKN